MVRLMVETVALQLSDVFKLEPRASKWTGQPQQNPVTIARMKVAAPTSYASSHHLQGECTKKRLFSADYCAWGPTRHLNERALARAASCPKNGDQPKSPLAQLAA